MRILCFAILSLALAGCSRQPAQPVASGAPGSTAPPTEAAPPAPQGDPAPATTAVLPGPGQPEAAAAPETADSRPSPFAASRRPSAPAAAPVRTVIPAGTKIHVRLGESINTRTARPGSHFIAHLDQPVLAGDRIVLPKGTVFKGHVVDAKSSGRLKGRAYLAITLDSFQLNGSTYPIETGASARTSGSHKKRNLLLIGGGSGTGAAIGAIAGGGIGALIGAGAGAAAGTTGAVLTGKKDVKLPAETPLTFSLRDPVSLRG
jgi:hypothetical protein